MNLEVGAICEVRKEHPGIGAQPASGGADAVELGQGAPRGKAEKGQQQVRGLAVAVGNQPMARLKMERDVLAEATAYFAKAGSEVRLH